MIIKSSASYMALIVLVIMRIKTMNPTYEVLMATLIKTKFNKLKIKECVNE